jgi:tetratricopeptide (TPR) repeat protein
MVDPSVILAALLLFGPPEAAPLQAPSTAARKPDSEVETTELTVARWTDFAFEVATAIPNEIHGRERAKAQHAVVRALVEQGRLLRAAQLAPAIKGWRQGEALAEVALAQAKAGDAEAARNLAKQALALVPGLLDWQRERVRVMVGRVYVWLGDQSEADRLGSGVGESEMGKIAAARAARFPAEQFDAQIASLEDWIKTRNFDLVRNSVDVALEFYVASLKDAPRRSRIETLVAAANDQLAFDLRIANLLRISEILRVAGEPEAARGSVAKADAVLSAAKWTPEDAVLQRALIARAKARLGDREQALADLDTALAHFDGSREQIVDIFRARPLRAVAEAYATLGERDRALAVYSRAVDEGALNPNARPRAEDLSATALSMGVSGIVPSEALEARLQAIRAGLAEPW